MDSDSDRGNKYQKNFARSLKMWNDEKSHKYPQVKTVWWIRQQQLPSLIFTAFLLYLFVLFLKSFTYILFWAYWVISNNEHPIFFWLAYMHHTWSFMYCFIFEPSLRSFVVYYSPRYTCFRKHAENQFNFLFLNLCLRLRVMTGQLNDILDQLI